jgi:hypothetical protein
MREVDWGSTPLGPVSQWPQSLRTSVSIMLESRLAMVGLGGEAVALDYVLIPLDRNGYFEECSPAARTRPAACERWPAAPATCA